MAKAITKAPAKMVWQIFKFYDRFEYTHDAFRKKPLVFIKSFVGSGSDDVSAEYFKQMQDLRLFPEYLMLKGMFGDLRDISANAGIKHRGYLLDGSYRPATSKLIGSWVGLDARAANTALKKIEAAGLIEQVPLPDFDAEDETPPPKPPEKTKTKKQVAAEKRKAKAKAKEAKKLADEAAKAEKQKTGENREKSEKQSEPLKNDKTAKRQNGKTESLTTSDKTTNPENINKKTTTGPKGQGQQQPKPKPGHHPVVTAKEPKGNETVLRIKTGQQGAVVDVVGQGNGDTEAIASVGPSTAPDESSSLLSTNADGPHSKAPVDADGLSTPTNVDGGSRLPSGATGPGSQPPPHHDKHTPPTFEQKYDPACIAFAMKIYQTLGVPYLPDSPKCRRQLGSFGGVWDRARHSGIGDDRLGTLWGKAVAEADKLRVARRRQAGRSTTNYEAVWVSIFNKRLDTMVADKGKGPAKKAAATA